MLKGKYKEKPNNPKRPDGTIHEYCPPELVKEEMERLIQLYQEYEGKIAPELLSAWLHHRFTQIHPFQDGNGRVARAIASLVFLKEGWFPLVIRDSERDEYITALEKADNGDLSPLVQLFTKRQKHCILSALGIKKQIEEESRYTQMIIIKSAVSLLKKRSEINAERIGNKLINYACQLQEKIVENLGKLEQKLNKELKPIKTYDRNIHNYNANLKQAKNGDRYDAYFYNQIVTIANFHDYYANLDQYKSWSQLAIFTKKIFEIIFSIHGYGYSDSGVMVVSAFTFEKIITEKEPPDSTSPKPAHPDLFQFNAFESEESIFERFEEWIEESLNFALAQWQKTIS